VPRSRSASPRARMRRQQQMRRLQQPRRPIRPRS